MIRIEILHPGGTLYSTSDEATFAGEWLERIMRTLVIDQHFTASQIRVTVWPL